jgi:hypothetical protein
VIEPVIDKPIKIDDPVKDKEWEVKEYAESDSPVTQPAPVPAVLEKPKEPEVKESADTGTEPHPEISSSPKKEILHTVVIDGKEYCHGSGGVLIACV